MAHSWRQSKRSKAGRSFPGHRVQIVNFSDICATCRRDWTPMQTKLKKRSEDIIHPVPAWGFQATSAGLACTLHAPRLSSCSLRLSPWPPLVPHAQWHVVSVVGVKPYLGTFPQLLLGVVAIFSLTRLLASLTDACVLLSLTVLSYPKNKPRHMPIKTHATPADPYRLGKILIAKKT